MHLEGSCRCGAVRFSLDSPTPVPFMHCYCNICRKSAGGGGYAINLGGDFRTLKVEGEQSVGVWQATIEEGGRTRQGTARRHFCTHCGTALWVYDPTWPELVHPFASAIDTPLPEAPEKVHIMLDFKAPWVPVPSGPGHVHFARYPEESLEDWHRRHGLLSP